MACYPFAIITINENKKYYGETHSQYAVIHVLILRVWTIKHTATFNLTKRVQKKNHIHQNALLTHRERKHRKKKLVYTSSRRCSFQKKKEHVSLQLALLENILIGIMNSVFFVEL